MPFDIKFFTPQFINNHIFLQKLGLFAWNTGISKQFLGFKLLEF